MGPGAHSRLRGEGARVRSWLRLTSRSMRRPRVSSGRRQRGEVSVEVRRDERRAAARADGCGARVAGAKAQCFPVSSTSLPDARAPAREQIAVADLGCSTRPGGALSAPHTWLRAQSSPVRPTLHWLWRRGGRATATHPLLVVAVQRLREPLATGRSRGRRRGEGAGGAVRDKGRGSVGAACDLHQGGHAPAVPQCRVPCGRTLQASKLAGCALGGVSPLRAQHAPCA